MTAPVPMYIEIEHHPENPRSMGRGLAWVRKEEDGWSVAVAFGCTRRRAERNGLRLLAKHSEPKFPSYRLDVTR